MTANAQDSIFNSQLAALGSPEKVTTSFNVGAQSITTSAPYYHPVQEFAVSDQRFLSTVMFNFSFEGRWRKLQDFSFYQYDTSYNYTWSSVSVTAAGQLVRIYTIYNYLPGRLSLQLIMVNANGSSTVNTNAFTCSVIDFQHRSPFVT